MKGALLALVAMTSVAHAQGDTFDPRVMVLPAEGNAAYAYGAEVADALAEGASTTASRVARATASLSDTAVIVGCEPTEHACVDQVAAALNVDQLLIARINGTDAAATVEVTAITREAEPLTESFPLRRAKLAADLAAIRDAVPRMLEEGEARRMEAIGERTPEEPPPVEEPPPPVEEPPPRPVVIDTPPASKLPPALVVGGGVALAVGATFWFLASRTQAEIDDAPDGTAAELDALAALEDKAAMQALVGNVAVIAGAAVAAVGGVLWWKDRRDRASFSARATSDGAVVTFGGVW